MRDAGAPLEDIDITHARTLNNLLLLKGIEPKHWSKEVRGPLVQAWHKQEGESLQFDMRWCSPCCQTWVVVSVEMR